MLTRKWDRDNKNEKKAIKRKTVKKKEKKKKIQEKRRGKESI